MKSNLDKIALELYKKLQTRFNNVKIANEYAEVLSKKEDIPQARFFEFEYTENSRPYGTVAMSLDEDDGLIIQISGNLTSNKSAASKFFDFIRSFRQFAKRRLMKFNIRNIGKRNLDQRDYTFQAKRKEYPPMQPIMENKLYGSNKISYQDLGEARLIIKHSQPINTDYAAGRSQHIQNIYIENIEGERFKYPFKHLNGARALAEHIKHGGNPYDSIGRHITGLSEELAHLRKFKNYVGRQDQISEAMGSVSDRVIERIENIKKQVNQLQRSAYYEEFAESFVEQEERVIPEELVNDWVDRLTIRTFNEELKGVFPYLYELIDENELPVKSINPDDLLGEDSVDEELSIRGLRDKAGNLITDINSLDWSKYSEKERARLKQLHTGIDEVWSDTPFTFALQLGFNEKNPEDSQIQAHVYDRMNEPTRKGTLAGVTDVMQAIHDNNRILTLLRKLPNKNELINKYNINTGSLIFGFEILDDYGETDKNQSMFIPISKVPLPSRLQTKFTYNTFIRGGYHPGDRNTTHPIVWINVVPNKLIWERPPAWAKKDNLIDGLKSSIDAERARIAREKKDELLAKKTERNAEIQDIEKPREIKFPSEKKIPDSDKITSQPAPELKSNDAIPQTTATDSNKPNIYANFGKAYVSDKRKGKKESIDPIFESLAGKKFFNLADTRFDLLSEDWTEYLIKTFNDYDWSRYNAEQKAEIDRLRYTVTKMWEDAGLKLFIPVELEKDEHTVKSVHLYDRILFRKHDVDYIIEFMKLLFRRSTIVSQIRSLKPGEEMLLGDETTDPRMLFPIRRINDGMIWLDTAIDGGYQDREKTWVRELPQQKKSALTNPRPQANEPIQGKKQFRFNKPASSSRPFTPTVPKSDTTSVSQPSTSSPIIKVKKRRTFTPPETETMESMFESFMEALAQGNSGIFSQDPLVKREAIDKLNDLLSRELLAGPDGINARNSLRGIIDDPVFLESLRDMDNLDVRALIKDYIKQQDPDLIYELRFSEPSETAPETEMPEPEPMPTPAPAPTPPEGELGGEMPGAEVPPEQMPPGQQPPTPMAERLEFGKRSAKSRARPGFTFRNHRRFGLKRILKKAQKAGATLETVLNIGDSDYTIEDIINECGFSFEECGFESPKSGIEEVLDSIMGFWNSEAGNFTKGGEGVKTIVIKKAKDGEFKHASDEDIEYVLRLIDKRDPSSNQHNQISRIKDLAGLGNDKPFLNKFVSDREQEIGEVINAMRESAVNDMKNIINKINTKN